MTASSAIDSVYVSGWEYNRLLSADPCQPRISALPASLLWLGAHQLWLFDKVIVTQEAFNNEREASARLGWLQGDVLEKLQDLDALRVVDWSALPRLIKGALADARTVVLGNSDHEISVGQERVRRAIRERDNETLEALKTSLMAPLFEYLRCYNSGVPNSVSAWPWTTSGSGEARPSVATPVRWFLDSIAELLIPGLQLCRPPGTGLRLEDLDAQRHVQKNIEAPMIADLLAGEHEFAGSTGFVPYLERLEPWRSAYEPVNRQLRSDYLREIDRLQRLREVAAKRLWPDLHGEWLPRVESGDRLFAEKQLPRLIRRALKLESLSSLLDSRVSRIAIAAMRSVPVGAATYYANTKLGVSHPWDVLDTTTAVGWASQVPMAPERLQTVRVGLFYHEARKVVPRVV